jgi:cysteinyl-tRNA synthetase
MISGLLLVSWLLRQPSSLCSLNTKTGYKRILMNLFSIFKSGKTESTPHKPIHLHNTLSLEKEIFESRKPDEVRMYDCGPTVYDTQHIGNLRPYVFADILRRTLEYNNYKVKQVINITDVGHLTGDNEGDADTGEDKLEKAAKAKKRKVRDIAKEVTKDFFKDLERININTKSIIFPKATDHIRDQIAFVSTLEEKGYTYKTKDGIYFDTSRFKDYGKLGNINLEGLREGARIGEHGEKRNPTDFALWKFSPKNSKRQQEWESPWGIGFPGWHIECSAMAMSELGKQIDIHTGGTDHIPVHHNNEIAQTESITSKQFATFWLHNEFITIEGKKVSKSIGNTIYLRNIIDRGFSPLSYRYLLLTASYRSPINFTWDALEGAQTALFRLYKFFTEELGSQDGIIISEYKEKFHEMINDDLDTPKALALLWELVKDENIKKEDKRATILHFDQILGLGLARNKRTIQKILSLKVVSAKDLPEEIQNMLEEREKARKENNWEKADRIRDEIQKQGYRLEDSEKGPKIEKVNS